MRWSLPLVVLVLIVLATSGLSGCLDRDCRAAGDESCARLVKVVGVTAMEGAFDLDVATATLHRIGFNVTDVNGTVDPPAYDDNGNRTGVQVWADGPNDTRLGLLVSGGHLEAPDDQEWGFYMEFRNPDPRVLPESVALERAEELQVDAQFLFQRTYMDLERATGWQQSGKVSFRPVMEPVGDD